MATNVADLIRELQAATVAGRLQWVQLDEDSFRTKVGAHLIRIGTGAVRMETEPERYDRVTTYTVTVTDSGGLVVEDEQFHEPPGSYSPAEQLFKAARRSARSSGKVLDEIINTLQVKSR